MKKLLILAPAFLVINFSFADCGCRLPSYTEDDETHAIYNFMSAKLDVTDVRDITLTETIPYTTYSPSQGQTRCEAECLNKENSIRKFNVEFIKSGKLCSVNLKVTMTSRGPGFKSLVKQKFAPVCQ